VGFFLAAQPGHAERFQSRVPGLIGHWGDEFSVTDAET
jgi:hypothetical protein